MQIVSVNVGLPREIEWRGITVSTGIFKEPVAGEVAVKRLNLAGDRQADLSVHGGNDKAVYGYPSENYEYWRKELPETPFTWGYFGENLTTTGLREDALYIGDRLKIGSAVLTVTQPRLPCYKLGLRFGRDDIIKRFLVSQRSGFYFSVFEEGVVSAGSPLEIVHRDPLRVSIVDLMNLFFNRHPDVDMLDRAQQLQALPESWKMELQARVRARPGRPTSQP
jgi:MOSC domain-containing protein YiiM